MLETRLDDHGVTSIRDLIKTSCSMIAEHLMINPVYAMLFTGNVIFP